MKKKRTFSKAEKLFILKEASVQGVKVTLEKHGIYPSTYYSWRSKFKEMGKVGLDHGINKRHLKRFSFWNLTELEQLLLFRSEQGQ